MDKFLDKTTRPPKFKPFRLFKSMWRQKSKTPLCPDQPRLDGKLAIVTGGNNGIGYETSRGLVSRGAEVIILARNRAKSNQAINNIKNEFGGKIHYIPIDLADITSIISAVEEIALKFPEQKVDILVANAGVAPKTYSKSSDGYELSFAINVLGHHMLLKFCHKKSLLKSNAHVITVAGDIYMLENDCTMDYTFKDGQGMKAYSRSKLGVMWWSKEILHNYPNLLVNIVHPGVVATNLGGDNSGFLRQLISKILILSPKEGAQTTLMCATQPNVINGAYYHNTMGQVIFPSFDHAIDLERSKVFWNLLENIALKFTS